MCLTRVLKTIERPDRCPGKHKCDGAEVVEQPEIDEKPNHHNGRHGHEGSQCQRSAEQTGRGKCTNSLYEPAEDKEKNSKP